MSQPEDQALDTNVINRDDYDLAVRHAPRIRFDIREPFLPSMVGYTVFRTKSASPSFPREIELPDGAVCAIEYAVWWDWEIQHLYELEHIWIYLDANEQIIGGEASWHGGYHDMHDGDALPVENKQLILYSEPGKHAFAPARQWLIDRADQTRLSCGAHAGRAGVLVTPLFEGKITSRTPLANRAVHSYLECLAFEPSFDFSNVLALEKATFVAWDALEAWIPERVAWCAGEVQRTFPIEQQHLYTIAHRGASAYAPENSLDAFRKAAEMGSDLVEVDIRVTADGVPVVTHDATLKRVFGVDGVVSELTLERLNAITPEGMAPVPTFAQVAEICADLGMGLYLDIKDFNADAGAQVLATLERTGLLKFCIAGSFRPDLVADIKAFEPRLYTSILFGAVNIDPVGLAQAIHADYVHPCWERRAPNPHTLLSPEWITRVHNAGLGIVCWHEERPDEIAALRTLGVDMICSDNPDRVSIHKTICPP